VSAAAVPGTMTVCSSRAVRSEDRGDQLVAHSGGVCGGDRGEFAFASSSDTRRAAATGEDLQHRGVGDLRANSAFQGGMDASEQAADAVADPGGLAGQVIVEPDQHFQFGQRVVTDVDLDLAQRVGQGTGGVGDDERVPRVGLRPAGIKIGDAAHGQAGQVRHLVPTGTGHCNRQGTDRRGLIDHNQQWPMRGELVEHRPQLRFTVGQSTVVQPLPGRVQGHGVMLALAHIQTEENIKTADHPSCLSSGRGWSPVEHRRPAPTLRRDLPTGGRVPIQRSFDAPGPVTPPPGSCARLGA
jgi:hypothetical protein